MENFVRGKELGRGSFGCAILCKSKRDGKNYVIKEIDVGRMPHAEREASKQEATVRRQQQRRDAGGVSNAAWLIGPARHSLHV